MNEKVKSFIDKYKTSQINYELECIITKQINLDKAQLLLGILKNNFNSDLINESYYLNVNINNIRKTINGKKNIIAFFNNEKLEGEYLIKEKIDQDENNNYGYKINLKYENEPTKEEISQYNKNYFDIHKYYRLIERYSFVDNILRIDISFVKSAKNQTIINSNILNNPVNIEIEIELINKNISNDEIFNKLNKTIIYILQIINGGRYLMTVNEKNDIFNEFSTLCRNNFIGPRPIALTKDTITNINIDEIQNDHYLVSAKADGERYLLYISLLGNVYLINNNKDIINTGLISDNFETIIDGEYITEFKKGLSLYNNNFSNDIEHLFDYRAFDIYYHKSESVYTKTLNERLDILNNITFTKKDNLALNFSVKEYYNLNDLNIIINNDNDNKLNYNIDGIIFQPLDAYITETIKEISNHKIFKWKSENYNTIDFIVNINKVKEEYELTFYSIYSNKNKFYKIPFISINPYIYNSHIQYQKEIPISDEGETILNNIVVECYYDISNTKWNIKKIRHDKTAIYKSGQLNKTANNIWIANSTWTNIFNPVFLEDISSKESLIKLINQESNKSVSYYNLSENNITKRGDFQKLQNKIKTLLINSCIEILNNNFDNIKCLDIGCGRGGDLFKYVVTNHVNNNSNHTIKNGIKMLLGIDIDEQGIIYYNTKTRNRGARARYLELVGEYLNNEYKPEIIQNNDIYYIPMDISKDTLKENTTAISNEYDKELFNLIWNKFNLETNNFEFIHFGLSIHFFFENTKQINNIMQLINNNLKNNGIVLIEFMDSELIKELFKNNKEDIIDLDFAIIRKIDNFNKKIGNKIGVKLKTTNKEDIEYLIDLNYITELFNKQNMYLLSSAYLNEDINKEGYFKDIYLKYNYNLNTKEKEFSNLYRYAIFQKNDNSMMKIKKSSKSTKEKISKNNESSSLL